MCLKKRILLQTFSASLALVLVLSLVFFALSARMRETVLAGMGEFGNGAALLSSTALEEQAVDKIVLVAQSMAAVFDERLAMIENHTRTTADIAGSIYTRPGAWRPKKLPYVAPGQTVPSEPYVHAASGADLSRIRAEVELAGNIADMIRQIVVVDRGISTSAIDGESGYVIAMDALPWPSADFDPRTALWYAGAREKGGLFWTGLYLDLRGRGPVVSCAAPFYDQSSGVPVFRGTARSTITIDSLSKITGSAKTGRGGYFFLLDKTGLRIFSSERPDGSAGADGSETGGIIGENYLRGENSRLRSLALNMISGVSGISRLELDGTPSYVAYAPIHTLGWGLGVVISEREVNAPAAVIGDELRDLTARTRGAMDSHLLYLAGFIGLTLLLSLAAVAFFSARFTSALTEPILALNRGVQKLSGGNLEGEVRVKTGDELEELASSFNRMTGRLREYIGEISRATAERQRIETELDVATRIQMSLLPANFPPFPDRRNDFELFAAVHPAKEVGGDFYDFFFIDDDHFAALAGDVSGKGIPAAIFMAITKTLIKNRLQTGEAAETALDNVNRQLYGSNSAGMFVTLWVGILEISSGRLEFINAGHNPPLVKRGEKEAFEFIRSEPDFVLAATNSAGYHVRQTFLGDGETLFLYTDGITEAENKDGVFYGEKRLRDFLDSHGELPLRELLPALHANVASFSFGMEQSDDITMLALQITRKKDGVLRFISLPADLSRVGEFIAFIQEELDAAVCPQRERGQIELAAEEIFVNIVSYAYQKKTGCPVPREDRVVNAGCGVEKTKKGTVFTLSFADRGEPFNPLDYPEPDIDAPLENRAPGGLGILIVKRTMDMLKYSYDDGMNRLIVKKKW